MFGLRTAHASNTRQASELEEGDRPLLERLWTKTVACVSTVLLPQQFEAESDANHVPNIFMSTTESVDLLGPANNTDEVTDDTTEAEHESVMTALRTVGLHLTRHGFELGKDFSVADGKLMLNSQALAYLQDRMGMAQLTDILGAEPELLIHDN